MTRHISPRTALLLVSAASSLSACTAILGGFDFEGPATGGSSSTSGGAGGTTTSSMGGAGGTTTSSMGGAGGTTTSSMGGAGGTTTSSTGTGGATGGAGGTGGAPTCTQGETQPCYTGPAGTEGKGICKAGVATCLPDGTGFGACAGDVVPAPTGEDCNAPGDENCDGIACSDPVAVELFDNSSYVGVTDVAVDPQGNVFLAGRFVGSVTFGTKTLIAAGLGDYFLIKTDSAGTVQWAKQFGNAVDNGSIIRVAVDSTGNVVIAGELKGSADFGAGSLTSAGAEDVFVAKLDPAGNHKWSKLFGDSSAQIARGVAVDNQGDVIVGGSFLGTFNLGGAAMTAAYVDAFIAKLAGANGAHLWSKRIGEASGQPNSQQVIQSVAVDPVGNVGVAGSVFAATTNSVNLGGMPYSSSSALLFIGRFDGAGNHSWSVAFPVATGGTVAPSRMAFDGSGSAIIWGRANGTIDLGGGQIGVPQAETAHLAKFSAAGAHQWSKAFTNADTLFVGTGLAVDPAKNIIFTGSAAGAVNLGGGLLNGTSGTFIGKLDTGGNHVWSKLFAGASPTFGNVATFTPSGNIAFVASQAQGTTDYGTGPQTCTGTACTVFATFQP